MMMRAKCHLCKRPFEADVASMVGMLIDNAKGRKTFEGVICAKCAREIEEEVRAEQEALSEPQFGLICEP